MKAKHESIRILLVAESLHDRLLFHYALSRGSTCCHIVECDQGALALAHVKGASEAFDIVVADAELPDMSGVDLYRKMRARADCPPFVVLFTERTLSEVAGALEEGVYDYLAKDSPIYREVLPLVLKNASCRHKDQASRKRAEDAAEEARRALEQEVSRRTSQLLRTNSRLKLEIEERRRLEEDLKGNEELFTLFMSRFPGMVYLKDEQGRFMYLNRYIEDVYGMAVSTCIGRTPEDIWPREVSEAVSRDDRLVLETGADHQKIETLPLEGRLVSFFTQKFPIPGSDGSRIIGGISLDVTDYRRTEERNRLLVSAIGNATESVFILDGEGVIQYLNPAAERSLSVSRRELIGTSYEHYLSRQTDTGGTLSLGDIGARPFRGIMERSQGDETKRELDVIIAPVCGPSGEVTNYTVIEHDVTEEKALQHALERKRRIEALGMLAGGIAHDFINILQPILINAELVSETLPPDAPEREFLNQIIQAAKVGKDITNQIKMFSSRKKQRYKPVGIEPMVRDSLRIISQSLPPGIVLQGAIQPTQALVSIAPPQFYQLLANLCMNAVQAMEGRHGILGVALEEVLVSVPTPACVSILNPGEYQKLTVSDTGCGMSPEVLDKIFDPLFTTRKSSKGTGLGLGVVHAVVKNAGGSIIVTSRPGEGSSFEVYLPRYQGAPEDGAHESVADGLRPGLRRGRVLLVDDNGPELKSIHRMLVRMGYRVASTSDSGKALSLFRHTPEAFDLLITDQIMPSMNGDQLASKLLEIRSDLPVIICSGSYDALEALKDKPAAPAVYLSKPFSSSHLGEAIGQAFRRETRVQP
ncbi:MAG TPA: response regulator [Deltaproteobacteria bacterium]|jgi:PAS domain S-box-containing protein|nr:response regulator [Deltaproteobacteria bacterium]HOI07770.1 response regulator [Deltaproteobacteria bacterium]